MSLWVIALAPLIGMFLAMFGAGGGMLTVPLLVYGVGMPLKSAIAASLWIVVVVSLTALLRQQVWKQVQPKLLAYFMVGGVLGSWLGAHLGLAIPDTVQGVMFAVLVWFVAWWMYRQGGSEASLRNQSQPCRCALTLAVGVVLGVVTGVLGVGGGFLMVPALIWLGVSDFKVAVSHSLILIVINAMVAGMTYLGRVELAWQPMLWITGLAAIGCLAGSMILNRFTTARLQTMFSLLLLLVGGIMLYDAIGTY
ncbi:MAG: sulfite exporter TauE/SafE family protein [Mariprofundus sp.]|nr:sulfite exporter TauE/SafE family protein [Mariprofundus sp.]